MISKNTIAYIRSLHDKSTRFSEGVFLVEWRKCMSEFMDSDFEIVEGFFSEDFAEQKEYQFPYQIVTKTELDRISTLTRNDCGILLIKIKQQKPGFLPSILQSKALAEDGSQEWQKQQKLILVLDRINDPGNLGTIIRTADWYGVSQIICSPDTVDCYNPKVLMATMGSFTRVLICYTDLEKYLVSVIAKNDQVQASKNTEHGLLSSFASSLLRRTDRASQWHKHEDLTEPKIYWAYLDGESTHTKDFGQWSGYLVIGSEAHGISANLEQYITDRVTIPRFWLAESLNAGIATAVILDRMRG